MVPFRRSGGPATSKVLSAPFSRPWSRHLAGTSRSPTPKRSGRAPPASGARARPGFACRRAGVSFPLMSPTNRRAEVLCVKDRKFGPDHACDPPKAPSWRVRSASAHVRNPAIVLPARRGGVERMNPRCGTQALLRSLAMLEKCLNGWSISDRRESM